MTTTVRGVRSVEIELSDPGRAAGFFSNVWQLKEIERRQGSIWFRGTGSHHHILAVHPASRGFASAASCSTPPMARSCARCTVP
jgi:catechol 2,3-dioxygenase